ncbi:hypothetical protein [Allobranchiibius sp. GilTou38]|uniref:zinc finger domain-containing protein n=1 Tax=Allobranchiibius sp. GilTou38 TaxID=2815210 RepID=UPI001AA1171A|nr:hypothetical protein [Allobranchiibius sp. GilTou38]MBO1768233.1 hypothetical protein [Allobranchiibius sp. GilTou38]
MDRKSLDSYFGSGHAIQEVIAERGVAGLEKRLLAVAEDQVTLHYLEMVAIAEARKDGARLLNGDFGGPRPFPVIQRALWAVLPQAMFAALLKDHDEFHSVLTRNQTTVEEAIRDAVSAPATDVVDGFERDLRATQDLSHPCPTCGATVDAVCRSNSKSSTKPHNPTVNHRGRPRS